MKNVFFSLFSEAGKLPFDRRPRFDFHT